MSKRLSLLAVLAVVIVGAIALSVAGCGDDSSDSTSSSGLYGGPACQDDLASAACIEEVEANTGEAVQEGEEKLSEEGEEFSEEGEAEYGDPSETVKPPSEK